MTPEEEFQDRDNPNFGPRLLAWAAIAAIVIGLIGYILAQ